MHACLIRGNGHRGDATLVQYHGPTIEGVVASVLPGDRLDGVSPIDRDELSCREHHPFVAFAADHFTGGLAWAPESTGADTTAVFCVEIGIERANEIAMVSVDRSPANIDAAQTMAARMEHEGTRWALRARPWNMPATARGTASGV